MCICTCVYICILHLCVGIDVCMEAVMQVSSQSLYTRMKRGRPGTEAIQYVQVYIIIFVFV